MTHVNKYERIRFGQVEEVSAHERSNAPHRFTNPKPAPTNMDAIRARRAMSKEQRIKHDANANRNYTKNKKPLR